MGLFDFFKKKPTEETPAAEEKRDGVVEMEGVEVETEAEQENILLDMDGGKDMNAAVHEVMDEEEIQIYRASADTLYQEDTEEKAEIEMEWMDADGETLAVESEEEAEAILEELTDIAGEILAEKPLAEDEIVVTLENGEVFTEETEEDGIAFVEELSDLAGELAEDGNQKEAAAEKENDEDVSETDTEKKGFFAKLKAGLDKTRKNILGGVDNVLGSFTKIDEDLFEELGRALIMADLGVQTTMDIVENLRKRVKKEHATDPSVIKDMLVDEITAILTEGTENDTENLPSPAVVLVIGVNGVGKTTTIG